MAASTKARRFGRIALKVFILGTAGIVALLLLILSSVNLPPVNQFIAGQINGALATTFKGSLSIDRLGWLYPSGVRGARVTVRDQNGQVVLTAGDVNAEIALVELLRSLIAGGDTPLSLHLTQTRVDQVDIQLIDDGQGTPTLAGAFEPREPSPEPDPDQAGATTHVKLDEIRIHAIDVRGALASTPIDADLRELDAALTMTADELRILLEALQLEVRQLPAVSTLSGRLQGEFTLPAAAREKKLEDRTQTAGGAPGPSTSVYALSVAPAKPNLNANFSGHIAGADPLELDVALAGEHVTATLQARSISEPTLKQLAPGLEPRSPASLMAKVEGALDDLGLETTVQQGDAHINARGRLRQGEEQTRITGHVQAQSVNLAQLLPDMASTSLALKADVTVSITDAATRASYRAVSDDSSFGGLTLPKATLTGDASLPAEQAPRLQGKLEVAEPGAETVVHYELSAPDEGIVLDLSSSTQLEQPRRLALLAPGLHTSGDVKSRVHLDQPRGALDAELQLALRDVRHPSVRSGPVRATVKASGDPAAPEIDLDARLQRVVALDRVLSSVRARASGTPERLHVDVRANEPIKGKDRPRKLSVKASLQNTERGPAVLWPALVIESPAGLLELHASRVATQNNGDLTVSDLELSGPGRAEASLRYAADGALTANLKTHDLDAGEIADILGVSLPVRLRDMDLEVELATAAATGHIKGSIAAIDFGKLRGSLRTDLQLERGELSGAAEFELAKAARAKLDVKELRVPLPPVTERELESTRGDVSLEGEIDLSELQPFLPLLGVERTQGRVSFDVDFARPRDSASPELRARATTKRLVLVGEREKVPQTPDADRARQAAPWTLRGIDFDLDAVLAEGRAHVNTRLFDRRGTLLHASANWKELGSILSFARASRRFLEAPVTVQLRAPRRAVESWPVTFRPTEFEGLLSASVDLSGTLLDPSVSARARMERFRPAAERGGPPGIDLETSAQYRPSGGRLQLVAHDGRRSLLDLASEWQGDARDLAADPDTRGRAITMDLDLDLQEFPIEIIPALHDRKVAGRLSGKAELARYGRNAELNVELQTKNLAVDRLSFAALDSKLRAAQGKLLVETSLRGKAGSATAQLESAMLWGNQLAPKLTGAMMGRFNAKDLRLGALQPLVDQSVSELDGKLDADFQATFGGGAPELRGRAQLRDGVVQLPTIGQRFHDIGATVALTPESLEVTGMRARGISGGFEADAKASLSGLELLSAQAEVRIPEKDKLPLTIEGEAIGDAWGTVSARYEHRENERVNELRVDLERLHVDLPRSPPQGIQSLDQPKHVRVGFWGNDGFVTVPLQPISETGSSETPPEEAPVRTIITVDIGSVRVKKAEEAEVDLTGDIRATLEPELDVQGKVEARRGKLDISGKQFDIERGTVSFSGDPADPIISAIARYDSPDGYTVYAEYTGTVTQGKLRLRSEPALSQDEILTLLMFGSPDGSFGAGGNTDSLSTAVSVAGGAATQGLNRALSGLTDLDVSTRIDTSTGSPRPELVLQLTPRITARVTQALGEPAPGQSPDRTFFTVELRVASAWSLSAMIGDRGASALDLIWRRRY